MRLTFEISFACWAAFLFNSEHMSNPSPAPPEEVLHRLQRCEGFLDLKISARARAEWERVPEAWRKHPVAQAMLLRLLTAECDWPAARAVAVSYLARSPEEAAAWIQLAYTTRRAENLAAAERILREARSKFPREAVIPYNLACYACQSGRLDEARKLLKEAHQLDHLTLAYAAEDEDMRPLWPELPEA